MIFPQLIASVPTILLYLGRFKLYFQTNQHEIQNLLQICKKWRHYLIPHIIPKLQFCTMCKIGSEITRFVTHLIDVTYLSVPDWFDKIAPQIKTLNLVYPNTNVDAFINVVHIESCTSSLHTCFLLTLDCKMLAWTLPKTVKSIQLDYTYLRFCDDMFLNLPDELEILHLPQHFNSPLTNLPNSLKKIEMGQHFNQLLILPAALKHLRLGHDFNQPIDLVDSLKYLKLENRFNQYLILPKHLKTLYIGQDYAHELLLPTSLKELWISTEYVFPDLEHLSQLTKLYICEDVKIPKHLPKTLLTLAIFSFGFNRPIETLPTHLTHLEIWSEYFNQPLGNLPKTLQILYLGNAFNHPLGDLPESLQKLQFGFHFNHCLGMLPSGLKHLTLGSKYQCCIENIPIGLETLYIESLFFSQIDILLPTPIPSNLKIYVDGKLV
jgi:hypothetical protein